MVDAGKNRIRAHASHADDAFPVMLRAIDKGLQRQEGKLPELSYLVNALTRKINGWEPVDAPLD